MDVDKTPSLRTHRLTEIVEECQKYYPQVESFKMDCDRLTVYYFDRYPSDVPLNLNKEDAEFALKVAGEILSVVDHILSST
ncbi:MAG: HEPN domain-containing protein [Deltaproteobacteria bacterium]|nr:HEPN domain-containing protein [Deltaproteobacteria bacterium]